MTDGFMTSLESYSRRIRRWATRRHIEQDGYLCETWYPDDTNFSATRVLTLERYQLGYTPGGYHSHSEAVDDGINANFYAPFEGEVWNHIHSELGWVDELITGFGKSDPVALQALIEVVRPVPVYLRADDNWLKESELAGLGMFDEEMDLSEFGDEAQPSDILLGGAMLELSYWSGATADAYTSTFGPTGDTWRDICHNNYALSEYLVRGAEAQLAVTSTARESVANICESTIEALWDVNEGSVEVGALLTIVGAVGTAALTVASFGVAAAVVGAMFTIAATAAADMQSADVKTESPGKDYPIDGATANDVLQSMASELYRVQSEGNQAENDVRDALRSAYNTVLSSAGARTKFEITLESEPTAAGMGEREMSMTIGDLEDVATVQFPRSAQRVFTSHAILAGSGGDDGAAFRSEWNDAASVVHTAWIDLRDLLQDLTATNAERIAFAGTFLLAYAKEVDYIDDVNAEVVTNADAVYDGFESERSGRDLQEYEAPPPDPTGRSVNAPEN